MRLTLEQAASRVTTIARAHERLYQTSEFEQLDIGAYLKDVCADLAATPEHDLQIEAETGTKISTDRAISLALIVVELVTNAVKYAYPEGQGGPIRVSVSREGGLLLVCVRDEGVGLPEGFDMRRARGLGMRIVQGLAGQLDAEIEARRRTEGTEFVALVPVEA